MPRRSPVGADAAPPTHHNSPNATQDRDEARRMISSLSGRSHSVVSGVALAYKAGEGGGDAEWEFDCFSEETQVGWAQPAVSAPPPHPVLAITRAHVLVGSARRARCRSRSRNCPRPQLKVGYAARFRPAAYTRPATRIRPAARTRLPARRRERAVRAVPDVARSPGVAVQRTSTRRSRTTRPAGTGFRDRRAPSSPPSTAATTTWWASRPTRSAATCCADSRDRPAAQAMNSAAALRPWAAARGAAGGV